VLAAAALVALGGCASVPLGAPGPSMENVSRIRAARLPALALGTFSLAPDRSASLDQSISIRTNSFYSPYGNSFASYLKEALTADLRAAGALDPASAIRVAAQLTESEIQVPSGTAQAVLAARFVVTRSGKGVYDKELRARATWQAEFNGFDAVPMAVYRYELLYRNLVAALVNDEEFRRAVTGDASAV
jgi:hypothetical protein